MLTYRATAWPAGTTWADSGKSAQKTLLHPCSEVRAPARYMHYLEFPHGTVNRRNYPQQIFFKRWVKGTGQPQNRLV